MPETPVRGRCLCGAVVFELHGKTTEIGLCHCSKCRRVSGTGSNATLIAGRESFRWIEGESTIAKFSLPDGWGPWRCKTCGSPVPKQHPNGEAWWVPAGLLDGDPEVRIAGHIFVGSKAPWDEIAGSAPRLAEGFGSERVE